MDPEEVVRLVATTVVSIAAGAELVYFLLINQLSVAVWAAVLLLLGLLSGRLLWP
jgi:membrane protein DedA with SNARE-associated domain